MKRFINLFFLFARPLQFFNAAFTIMALLNIYSLRGRFFLPAILLKLAGYVAVAAYQNFMDSRAFYFFQNSGHSVVRLYIIAFALDLLCFGLIVIILNHYHAFAHVKNR